MDCGSYECDYVNFLIFWELWIFLGGSLGVMLIFIWYCNLIDMVDVMSHRGDVRGDLPHPGGSRLPGSCKCFRYYVSDIFVLY